MNLLKKYTTKPYSFSLIDATLASDNPLHFRKSLLQIMTIDYNIRGERLQHDTNRERAKIFSKIIR